MTKPPMPPEGEEITPEPPRPPALSDLADTDALLDRLGAGTPSGDDLDDPAVAVLAELLAVVDDPAEVDGDVARLFEVLGGRPLYLVGADEEAPLAEAEAPIRLGPPEPRVIDLTASAEEPSNLDDESGRASSAATADPVGSHAVPVASRDVPAAAAVTQLPAARRSSHWERALQQVSLPAASILVLLVLGGGVSAVVTGDPMAPVNGVTRVVSQLPGVDKPKPASVTQVEKELLAAGKAAQANDPVGASHHLQAARQGIAALPDSDRTRLTAIVTQVQTQIDTGQPPSGIVTDPATGTGVVTATTPPVVVVPPTTDPVDPPTTDAPTPPVGTTPPTTDPVPPTTPPTTDPQPSVSVTSEATSESTPSAT